MVILPQRKDIAVASTTGQAFLTPSIAVDLASKEDRMVIVKSIKPGEITILEPYVPMSIDYDFQLMSSNYPVGQLAYSTWKEEFSRKIYCQYLEHLVNKFTNEILQENPIWP